MEIQSKAKVRSMPKILVIDDDKDIRNTLKETLEKDKHTILTSSSYDEAISILKSNEIEIIIVDIFIKDKSGLDFLNNIKVNFGYIQIIIITEESNLQSAIRATRSGAADYLAKPINTNELRYSIQRIFETLLLLKSTAQLDNENRQIRKQLENLLQEKTKSLEEIEERYKSVAMTSADAVIIMDENLIIVETNSSTERIFGYNSTELNLMPIFKLIPTLTTDSIEIFITNSENKDFQTNISGVKKDESTFPIEISLSKWISGSSTFYSAIIHNISVRKLAEEKAQKLSLAAEQSANSIVITDTEGKIEYANQRFQKQTGYSFAELKGQSFEILNSKNTNLLEPENLTEALSQGKQWTGEACAKKKNGKLYWESVSISPIKDDFGKITNFIAVKEDITEKKEAERIQQALLNISSILQEDGDLGAIIAKMHDQLSDLLNISNFFIAFYKKETKQIYFPYYKDENDSFEYVPAEGTLSYYTIKKKESLLIPKEMYGKLVDEKEILQIGKRPEIWAGAPIIINNEAVGVVVAQDYHEPNSLGERELKLLKFVTNQIGYVVERIRAKEALAFEKEELSVTISSLAEAVISTNLDGKITLVNQAVEKIFNVKQSMMLNELIFKFFWNSTDRGLEKIKSFYQRIKLGGVHYDDEQFSISFSQGKRKIIKVSTSSLKLSSGETKGVVFVIRDITQQLEIENQLALSQKMESIGQLAAGIAHEINTPMQYIGDNTTFLKDSFTEIMVFINELRELVKENPEFESKINEVLENLDIEFLIDEIPDSLEQSQLGIEKVRTLVLAMKDFAHPGQKQKTLSDINKGIEVTSTISKNEWKYIADLTLSLEPNLPLVPVILDEINQVVLNMIVNSTHAIEDRMKEDPSIKGEITITTRSSGKYVEILIKDNGGGIPKEKISRIFDPFYTTKEVGKGTGQGLAIAHNIIVNQHNGKISATSAEDKGTTMIIQLPLEEN